MSIPDKKELYMKMLHKILTEKLPSETGRHEEAIKNACYCMAFVILFSAAPLKREPLANFPIDFIPSFKALYPHMKCNHSK